MEDEEGYTALNLRPKGGNSARLSPAGYQELPPSFRCYKITLGALGAWCIVVTAVGIVLGVWGCCFKVCQGPCPHGNPPESDGIAQRSGSRRECNTSLEELFSHLKQSVCDPAQINPAGGAGCKLCPPDWRLHGHKCYWVSKGSISWSESREDCARRGSEMLVIQDWAQMGHLQAALSEAEPVWIGLTFNSSQGKWTWLDGAPVRNELFPGLGQAEANSCGVLQRNKIDFETCSVELKWLCQKAAFPL